MFRNLVLVQRHPQISLDSARAETDCEMGACLLNLSITSNQEIK